MKTSIASAVLNWGLASIDSFFTRAPRNLASLAIRSWTFTGLGKYHSIALYERYPWHLPRWNATTRAPLVNPFSATAVPGRTQTALPVPTAFLLPQCLQRMCLMSPPGASRPQEEIGSTYNRAVPR